MSFLLLVNMPIFIGWCLLPSFFSIAVAGAMPVLANLTTFNNVASSGPNFSSTPGNTFGLSNTTLFVRSPPYRHHPREFSSAFSNEKEAVDITPFPKFATGLLALSIVLCATFSALVITILYSARARAWLSRVASLGYASVLTARISRKSDKRAAPQESQEKKNEQTVLDITSGNHSPSLSTNPVSGSSSQSSVVSSREDIGSSNTTSPPSDPVPTLSNDHTAPHTSEALPSPNTTLSPRPATPLNRLQVLVSESMAMLRSLTRETTARCQSPLSASTPEVQIPTDKFPASSSDPSAPLASSKLTKHSHALTVDAVNYTHVPDFLHVQSEGAYDTIHDHSVIHDSQDPGLPPTAAFYIPPKASHLTPSIASQTLAELTTPVIADDVNLRSTKTSPGSLNNNDGGTSLSPRYVHGIELEIIHEEDEERTENIKHPKSTAFTLPDLSSGPAWESNSQLTSASPGLLYDDEIRTSHQSIHDMFCEAIAGEASDALLFQSASSPTEQYLNTRSEFSTGPRSPPLSRLFPTARPAPKPSEPTSHAPFVSALRSPDRGSRPLSVAWLSPVIDWAVDDSGDALEPDSLPAMFEPREATVNTQADEECEEALHAADAMAAVMDSFAAIGLDPTDLGLTAEEPMPSAIAADSSFMSFSDSVTSGKGLAAQSVAADLEEEGEVENAIGYNTSLEPPDSPTDSSNNISGRGSSFEVQNISQTHSSNFDFISGGLQHSDDSIVGCSSVSGANPDNAVADKGTESGAGQKLEKQGVGEELDRRGDVSAHLEQQQESQMKSGSGSRSSLTTGRVKSPSNSQPNRTPRHVRPDRLYPSPSSLAGLSPLDVAKRFSSQSHSSVGSTPSPHGKRAASPQQHFSPVSPLQIRKSRGVSLSPSFDCTPSTLTSSPRNDPSSPSPRSRSPVFLSRPPTTTSLLGSTQSTPTLSPRRNPASMAKSNLTRVSPSQRHKVPNMSPFGRSPSVLHERTNSMEFDQED